MTKRMRIVVFALVVLAIIGVVAAGAAAIVKNNGGSEPGDITRTEKLATPQNLRINDDWMLTFDRVSGAIGYRVYVDDQQQSETVYTTSFDAQKYASIGSHSFCVQALHSLGAFHSEISSKVYKDKTIKLATPDDVAISATIFSWGAVTEARSYTLLIEASDESPVIQYSTGYSYDLSSYIAEHADVTRFTVRVKATALDHSTGIGNDFILDSDFSAPRTYIRAGAITAPALSATFDQSAVIQQSDAHSISWSVDTFAAEYEVYLDDALVRTVTQAEFVGQSSFMTDLGSILDADSLGEHTLYVVAVPVTIEGLTLSRLKSNVMNYTVKQKLATVARDTITIGMDGTTLVLSWGAVPLAAGYTVDIQGRATESDEFVLFTTKPNIVGTTASIALSSDFGYREARARVMALAQSGHEYIQDADFSEWSEAGSTVTQLNSVGVITITENSDESVTASWIGQDQNSSNMDYVGSYFGTVYYASVIDGVETRGAKAFDFVLQKGAEEFFVSDLLLENDMDAGMYSLVMITLPAESASTFFAASAPTEDVFFSYKTRLGMPTGLNCQRVYAADGTSNINFAFYGVTGARGYSLAISGDSMADQTVFIPQPANYDGELIEDNSIVHAVLGGAVEPNVYSFSLEALASAEQGKLLDSGAAQYTFTDVFRHQAVDVASITFEQTGNTVIAKWAAVPTASMYNIQLNSISLSATATSMDITSALVLGGNAFVIECKAIPNKYTESVAVTQNFEYYYTISGTSEVKYDLVTAEDGRRLRISIDHFDDRVTGYAIQLGENTPQMMRIVDGRAIFDATIDGEDADLPLYRTTSVTIWAGVKNVDGGRVSKQDYIVQTKSISTFIINDMDITAPVLSVDEEQEILSIAMLEEALPFAERITFGITLDGRSMAGGIITRAQFYSDASGAVIQSVFEYNLRTLINGDASASLDVGKYVITATIFSSSGISADAQSVTYTKRAQLDNVDADSFLHAADNSYLQWDAVDGADSYIVTVAFDGVSVTDVIMPVGEYVTTDGETVVRINTISLFGEKGVGRYVFGVVAHSDDSKVADSETEVTHTWVLTTTLTAPTFEIGVFDGAGAALEGEVCAKILVQPFAQQFVVVVNGETISTVGVSTSATYQYVGLGIENAGKYRVQIKATQGDDESAFATREYIHTTSAPRPTQISATQDLLTNQIILSSAQATAIIINGSDSETVELGVEARLSTLAGEEYQAAGATVWFALVTSESAADLYCSLPSDAVNWLKAKGDSTYYVHFRTMSYTDAAIYAGGVLLDDSAEVSARLSYQNQLDTPTFAFESGTVVSAGHDVEMTVISLDPNANNFVDIEFTRDGSSRILSARKVVDGIVDITSEMLEDTRGQYSVRIRATNNGVYAASAWTDALEVTLATALPTAQGILFGWEYDVADGGVANTAELYVQFNAISDADAGTINYSATMDFEYAGAQYDFVLGSATIDDGRVRLALDYASGESTAILRTVLGQTAAADLVLHLHITATPSESSLCMASVTDYAYTIGQLAAPSDFVFETSGSSVIVSWTGDLNYSASEYETEYVYDAVVKDNSGATVEEYSSMTVNTASTTIDLPSDTGTAYLVEICITSVVVRSAGVVQATFAGASGDWYVVSSTTGDAALVVSYDTDTDRYWGTISHIKDDGTLFVGQKYSVSIADSVVATDLTDATFELNANTVSRLIAVNDGQVAPYTITISNNYYTRNGRTMTAFVGKDCSSTVRLPLVVSSAPSSVELSSDTGVMTITNIPYVTEYAWRIVERDGDESVLSGVIDSSSTATSTVSQLVGFAGLTSGEYTLLVKANSDHSSLIYADRASEASLDFVRKVAIDAPQDLSFETVGNGYGDFATTLKWTARTQLPANRFAIKFVSVSSESSGLSYSVDMSLVDAQFASRRVGGGYAYTLELVGLDLVGGTTLGYDLTREMPAGEYRIIIQILGDTDTNSLNSTEVEFDTTYQNKFGVTSVTSEAFAIAPECFFGASNVVDGQIVFGADESQKQAMLASYEAQYGFNTKYLVITQTGTLQNHATSYRVIVNGTDFGILNKASSVTTLDFESVSAASKLSLGSVWRAGTNTICLMPYAATNLLDYYYYFDGVNAYRLDTDTAKDGLAREFEVVMYRQFATPSDPRVELGYSDAAQHNIDTVNVSFANSTSTATYTVRVKYRDYYNSDAETLYATLTEQQAVFNGTQNVGISLYDAISAIGPHDVWFEVEQTGDRALSVDQMQYCIYSAAAQTTPFTFVTALQEFGTTAAASGDRSVSVVTAITAQNQDLDKAYSTNGHIRWNLPIHPFDMVAQYAVSLRDANGKIATQTAQVRLTVTDGQIEYSLIRNDNDLFYIDAQDYIYFDMTQFFANNEAGLSGSKRSPYYLAGVYSYQITATALDKNATVANNRIFDPTNPTFGYYEYEYKNVEYPLAPSDVFVSGNGVLSWQYSLVEDIYSSTTPTFSVVIETYNVDKTLQSTVTLGPTSELEMDIASYLVAGGAECNTIYVYRLAPNQYYEDSARILARFADDYDASASMPTIRASWTAKSTVDYAVSGTTAQVETVFSQLTASGSGAKFEISMLRVDPAHTAGLSADQNFDTIVARSDIQYVRVNFDDIVFNISDGVDEAGYSYDMLAAIQNMGKAQDWLNGANWMAGRYYVRVQFAATSHPYYTPAVAYITRELKSAWTVVSPDDTTLDGEFLTTKQRSATTAAPYNQNDRKWATAAEREAKLSFSVYALSDAQNVAHMPERVTVRVRLWDGSGYSSETTFSRTYQLPSLSALTTNSSTTSVASQDGDSRIYRVSGTSEYYLVEINIHDLFDTDAANLAGVYHLDYILEGDDVGDASGDGTTWYSYSRDICHYVALPTPILDYRLGMQQVGAEYDFVLNWALTPDRTTYSVVAPLDYTVNIFAFAQREDGSYLCDATYDSLDTNSKNFFLQNETAGKGETSSYGFALGCVARELPCDTLDGRLCYINDSDHGLELEPNCEYKFFVYLTPKAVATDPNSYYYIASQTSLPQQYLYQSISVSLYDAKVSVKRNVDLVVEGQQDYSEASVYEISAKQASTESNTGFELYIYDTCDPNAAVTNTWMLDQEANKNYIAHYIITTVAGQTARDLYVVDSSYVDGKNQPLQYLRNADGSLRKIGEITGSSISIDGFTIGELLGQNGAQAPITYYCKIKAWLNNNDTNAHASVGDDGMLQDMVIYDRDWIRRYITTDEDEVEAYFEALSACDACVDVPLADFNALNPGYYFTFQHTVRFAEPQISRIQLVDNSGSALEGACVVDYTDTTSGVTAGYVTADSSQGYAIRIYLDNVYNSSSVVQDDKCILLSVRAIDYSAGDTGIIAFDDTAVWTTARNVTLKVHYEGTSCWVELSKDSSETGATALYEWIDSMLPNKLLFTAQAVMDNPDNRTVPTGGSNTANKFVANSQDSSMPEGGYYHIQRNFEASSESDAVSIIVKKQYTAPQITYLYDDMTSAQLVDRSAIATAVTLGYESNRLDKSGSAYSGVALNPYLYVAPADSATQGGSKDDFDHEYLGLSNRTDTLYQVVFGYNNRTITHTFATSDINATTNQFAAAIKQNSTRFDYNLFKDVYPYEEACLYQKLYALVNYGTATGGYHGGVISAKIRVLAPSSLTAAGYWISSDERECADLSFYVRLETVRTSFDASEAQFADTAGEYHLANMFAMDGLYYYYQGYIPYHYYTISKGVSYRVTLRSYEFEYSFDTLKDQNYDYYSYSKCQWTPTQSGENIGNLAEILAIDRSSTIDADLNQWLKDREWSISILAYADETQNAQYVACGFESKVSTYTPKLKIVNDITSINIDMDVDARNYTVGELTADDITVTSEFASGYNRAAGYAVFVYDLGAGEQTWTVSIKQNVGVSCYADMIKDFVYEVFIEDDSVIGDKYFYSIQLTNDVDNVEASEVLSGLVFEYYRLISVSDFGVDSVNVAQESTQDDYITVTAQIPQTLTITGMQMRLQQTILGTTTQVLSDAVTLARTTSGSDYQFAGTWSFEKDYADCFVSGSSGSFTAAETELLTENGYVTSANRGHIQAGHNTFYLYPVQDLIQSVYNLWKPGSYIDYTAEFVVPSSYAPTIELNYSTSSEGGQSEAGARYESGGYYWRDYYTTAYYEYVDALQATVSGADGYVVTATWTYGWKMNTGETTCSKNVFTDSGSSNSLSTAIDITLAGQPNYADYQVTLSVKAGFEAYFVTPSVHAEIHPDVSGKHTERTFVKSVKLGRVPA